MSGRSHVNGVPVADTSGAVRELLRQRAVALGLIGADDNEEVVAGAIEALLDREVQTPVPAIEECRRFYDQHPADFVVGELVFARHILFAVTPGVPVVPLRRKAEQTLAELRGHPERFAELARDLSNCPSAQLDGNLGQLTRGECAPEFEQAVFGSGETGVLPRLVNTRYGFHIVSVDGRVAGRVVPFEAAQEKIAAYLAEEVARKALAQYVSVLAGDAKVEGVDLHAAVSPLVQ